MTTKFLDGPAAGEVLALRFAPVLLRVVRSPRGNWDALDQPDDEPRPRERIHVYRLARPAQYMFVRASKRSESGRFALAEYRVHDVQPPDELLRNNAAWAVWAEALAPAIVRELQETQTPQEKEDPSVQPT